MYRSHNVFRNVLRKLSFLVMCFTTTYLFMKQQALFVNMTERFQKCICHEYSNNICKYIYIYIKCYTFINSKALSIWNIWYGWGGHTRIYIIRKYSMHYMSIVFHDYVYRNCFWNLFASIFSTSVETNYLDRSIAARVLVANCLSPFFGWELFICTGTSYDNNNISYIYTEYQ